MPTHSLRSISESSMCLRLPSSTRQIFLHLHLRHHSQQLGRTEWATVTDGFQKFQYLQMAVSDESAAHDFPAFLELRSPVTSLRQRAVSERLVKAKADLALINGPSSPCARGKYNFLNQLRRCLFLQRHPVATQNRSFWFE